jgi:hypothetical protein
LSGIGLVEDHFKSGGTSGVTPINLGGLSDLAGITEIEPMDLGAGSRRGSFSRPMAGGNRNVGSESKERNRDNTAIGIPRPQTGVSYGDKRPMT